MARRLDKFTFGDISLVLELEDSEIEHFLAELVDEQIIVKNGSKYFFNIKKPTKKNKKGEVSPIKDIPPIIIEKEDGYDYFLTLYAASAFACFAAFFARSASCRALSRSAVTVFAFALA